MEPAVTFETQCWERDWKLLLKTDRLRQMAERNDFPFAEKVLMINNVSDFSEVAGFAEQAVRDGRLTRFYRVDDYADKALEFFDLSRASLGVGYKYSIGQLVGIFLCHTEFLLHYTGDCIPLEKHGWVTQALALFSQDPRIKVANLLCNRDSAVSRSQASEETPDFFIGTFFSDQCYLIRTADYRSKIYNHPPPPGPYPAYAGESFEKRTDAWMRAHGHLRATYKHASYLHQNVPPAIGKRMRLLGTRIKRSILWRTKRLKGS